MEKKVDLIKNINVFNSKGKIELETATLGLNIFLPTLLLIIISFFQNYELVSELSILIGVNIILTQIFSANARPLIIRSKDEKLVSVIFFFRIFVSIIVFIINLLLIFNYKTIFSTQLILLALIILQQWILEISITYYEIKNKKNIFYFYIFFSIIFIIFFTVCYLKLTSINLSLIFYNFFLIFNILLFLKKIKLKKIKKKYFSNFLKIIFKSEEFISSFSISFANLIWRLLVINYCGKILAGIYFAGFAVGSLPGSLFNNTFGPSIIKNKISINNNWLLFFKFILILLLFSSFIIFINFDIFSNGSITQLFCSIISILGSYFMIKGLFKRQQAIQKRKRNKNIFKIDIVYSIFIVLIIPLLYNLGGEEIVLYAFLFSSLTSFLTYNYLANKIFNL